MNKIKDILLNTELGKMKDKIPNDTINKLSLISLKVKAYCYTTVKGEEGKKIKGITKSAIENQIMNEDYKNALCNNKSKYVTIYTIDSKKHHIEKKEQYKIAIDPFDDKDISGSDGSFIFCQWRGLRTWFPICFVDI